jgi:hypothetical protein
MSRNPKRIDRSGPPGEPGNTSSADNLTPARPWTEEEMAAAKPLPLPTVDTVPAVDSAPTVRPPGLPYAGKGETKPAGRPEDDEDAAR